MFQPEIEAMPREELRALQLERLRESVRNAYENVPLYRERFDAAGVTPDDLHSLEDLETFPPMWPASMPPRAPRARPRWLATPPPT